MNEELKKIKKMYGEKMMQTCRSFFPQFLGKGDLIYNILIKYFPPTHLLYDALKRRSSLDIFRDFVDSILYETREKGELVETDKDPYTLMDEAGYILKECTMESEIQSYRHYYEPHEELCTFRGGRLDRCRVFFAVKKNVDEIRRENFDNPQREDLYGTSVISIQFAKTGVCSLSIKNRYNHTVNNPDATFYNDLERIIPGLTRSFEHLLGREINNQVFDSAMKELKSELKRFYVFGKDEKFYRWISYVDGIYFCENNVIVANGVPYFGFVNNKDSNRYLILNQSVIDLHKNEIFSLRATEDGQLIKSRDAFVKSIYDVGKIEKINLTNEKEGKLIVIRYSDGKTVTIRTDKNNSITEYENNYVTIIGDEFLRHALDVRKVTMNNVIEIGKYCLSITDKIEELSIPKVRVLRQYAFANTNKVKKLYLPEVERLEDDCFSDGLQLEELYAPKLKYIGRSVLSDCFHLHKIDLPSIRVIKDGFMGHCDYPNMNEYHYEISGFANIEEIGEDFLGYPDKLIIDPESMGIEYPTREVTLKEFYDILINQKHVKVNDPNLEDHIGGGHRI